MENKINKYFEKVKKNHPIAHKILHNLFSNKIIILLFWGLIVWGTIIPHILAPMVLTPIGYLLPSTDEIKPEIEGVSPNINERLSEPPKEIKISFHEEGGSGIDRKKSNILLKGARTGYIKEKSIEYKEGIITFIPNQSLEPDAYTINVEIRDRGGNIAFNSYSFYVLENPKINITVFQIPFFQELLSNTSNDSDVTNKNYVLTVSNQNNVFFENIELNIQFPGIITDYIVHYDNGVYGYDVWVGKGTIFYSIPTVNYSSCYSMIFIREIAPNGDFIIVFSVDLDIGKYNNVCWCKSGIEGYSSIFTSNFENRYKVSYNYQEYGFYYYDNFDGNFTSIEPSPIP